LEESTNSNPYSFNISISVSSNGRAYFLVLLFP